MQPNPPPRVVALVGMPGSGKSVCAEYLQQRGFFKYRFGQIVVDEVAKRGLELTPQNERLVREDIREQEGINAIAERALPILQTGLEHHQTIIIDGLYGFGEYKLLHKALGTSMIVIAVFAARGLRYARLAQRPQRPLTRAEAEERDFREIEHLEKGGPIAIADYTLLNEKTTADLLQELDTLLATLGISP